MPSLELYGCWRSSASQRLQIGLRLKKLPFSYTPVSLDRGEQHRDWYRAINPRAELPTLVVDGEPWVQTLAILETLEETFPEQGHSLLPTTHRERRICRAIAEQINSSMQPLLLPARLRKPIIEAGGQTAATPLEPALQAGIRQHQLHALNDLNTWLASFSGPFCLDSSPTMADACVVPQLDAVMRLGLDLSPFERLVALHRHCQSLEAFAMAAPDQQPDAPNRSSV
ncbi:maleylacetoacetate isomerase [Synechococcus sp. KORDI-52]|uniref:glutathione S-transferase N-terminal domain-containing protein n=1 Tax=Synechococcus sp. KORDI-52 TaxID=585425 RepID=UPI0004E08A33|nr:glutathione S-transferase N-terminal domain-containing protein [Synechococcus sp. KORDI-52]AII49686.1 maleylacetoacetate isomerase [Synechococcus sp. KORDI-52]